MATVLRIALCGCALLAACGAPEPTGELNQGVTDERWWKDPLFPGSTPYNFADGHTWYDSDIGGSYVTGSYVRLPVDANYIADWTVGPVHCTDGTTSFFWSPVFQTTVNGKTTNWVFNHLSRSFLGPNGRTKGWYNGGALVGLTGGGTCDTGYPTYSSGPHFCNEMRDYDPYTYWQPVADYTSTCQGSNGTSGVANPVCGGASSDPCHGATVGNGDYCGAVLPGGDAGKLYTCQGGVTVKTAACGCGCMQNKPGVPDVCNNCADPCSSAKYGNGGYCGGGLTGGDPNVLYQCVNKATAGTSVCKCGCTVEPPGTNDFCAMTCTVPDAAAPPPMPADMAGGAPPSDAAPSDAAPSDAATSADLAAAPDAAAVDAQPSSRDARAAGDAGTVGSSVQGGCSVGAGHPTPWSWALLVGLAGIQASARRTRRRRDRR